MLKLKNNLHFLVLITLIFAGSTSCYDQAFLDHVTINYLTSFGFKPEKQEPKRIDPKKIFEMIKTLIKPHKFEIKELSKREKIEFAFKASPIDTISSHALIDTQFVNKMELVKGGENSTDHLLSRLITIKNKQGHSTELISTHIGKKRFLEITTQPISDVQTLYNRQAIIQELVHNQALLEQCDAILQRAKAVEPLFLGFYEADHPVNADLFKKVYWGTWAQSLNEDSAGLELGTRLDNSRTISALGSPVIGIVVSYLISKFFYGTPTSLKGMMQLTKVVYSAIPWPITALYGGIYINGCLYTFADMQLNKNIANHMQEKLIGAASYITSMKKLHEAACSNEVLNTHSSTLHHLAQLSNDSGPYSDKFKELIDVLATGTFKGKPSFFSLTGRVLHAYKLMQDDELRTEFANALTAFGELDVYVAIAKKIKAQANEAIPYTFVTFIDGNKPGIRAQNFGNPFINNSISVPNTIELGFGNRRNVILTGPNTGGKSTCIKGLMLNVLLAQTFGIALAEDFALTPFSDLGCHMNITDDTAGGVSLFKAEVLRAKELINRMRALNANQFAFVIIDEIFTGTAPEKAEQLGYDFLKQIDGLDNCIVINATHYKKLTELEGEVNSFKNYHMGVITNEQGKVEKYTYQITPGISQINNAQQIVSEEHVIW